MLPVIEVFETQLLYRYSAFAAQVGTQQRAGEGALTEHADDLISVSDHARWFTRIGRLLSAADRISHYGYHPPWIDWPS